MEKKPKNYIIDVIPLTRLPLARQQYFSYEFERELPAGTLVNIPLFKRFLNGIVVDSNVIPASEPESNVGNANLRSSLDSRLHENDIKKKVYKLKRIANIIEENFLTPEQLELVKFISDYYLCPLGIALKFFIPKRVKARNTQHATRNTYNKKIILTKEQREAVNKISNFQFPISNFLLFGPASSGKTEVYINLILKLKAKCPKSQFLILLPELTLTPQAIERYGKHFKPEEIAVLHSKISKGEFYANWQKIKSGEAKIIIGTRMAVFAPFKNLKLIVIDEEQDMSFKQWDMNPRYDARKAAEKLAEIFKAKVVRGSATPSVETYYRALQKKYRLLKLSHLEIKKDSKFPISNFQFPIKSQIPNPKLKILPPKVEIVDMRKERWVNPPAGGYSPVSKALKSEIEYALKNKLQTILFVNRQGMSAFSICANCRTVLKCPQCERALIYENSGAYKCLHCSYKTDILATCLKCQGMIFRNIGLGTQKVEKEIQKLFPGAKIKRADFAAMKKRKSAEELHREFMRRDFDILTGTQMITKGWDNPHIGLVAIIDADNLLSTADFNADERAFQLIVQVAGRTARPGSKFPGKVIIQTFNPENFVIQSASEMNYKKFYQKEIAERKDLKYPPFVRLIKLIYQNPNCQKAEKEAKKVYDEIKALQNKENGSTVSSPQDPLIPKIRKNYRRQIIIKLVPDCDRGLKKELPERLRKVLINLDNKWIIDVDPVNII